MEDLDRYDPVFSFKFTKTDIGQSVMLCSEDVMQSEIGYGDSKLSALINTHKKMKDIIKTFNDFKDKILKGEN